MDLAREVHIAVAINTSSRPDDLLRDLCREATLLPALVAETTLRPAEERRDLLVEALSGLRRVETMAELVIELGHLKADQLADLDEAAQAFDAAVTQLIGEIDRGAIH